MIKPNAFPAAAVAIVALLAGVSTRAHEIAAPTFSVSAPFEGPVPPPKLVLQIIDGRTGQPTAARFTVTVAGVPFVPEALDAHGLRFTSVHQKKQQRFTLTYARGTGPVEMPLPATTQEVEVHVAKGFEWEPSSRRVDVRGGVARARIVLQRWANLAAQGWRSGDLHLHYDRIDRSADPAFLAALAGDDLHHAAFLVLKGGNLPGVWARQFAFGSDGEASDGRRLIRPGEEYRDPLQGHLLLLGITKVIEPISTGGIGEPPIPHNYPPTFDVLAKARALGGLGGVAHGGWTRGGRASGNPPTTLADTILGAVAFFEISNGFGPEENPLWQTDLWYALANAGYLVPAVAGTDLPNHPARDAWQPFFGSVRTYAKVGSAVTFEAWKDAITRGETFVTTGPLLSLSVNGKGPGATVHLPTGGGSLNVEAVLESPLPVEALEIVRNGTVEPVTARRERRGRINRLRVSTRLAVSESSWIAARGRGVRQQALRAGSLAHTGLVRVEVGGRSVGGPTAIKELVAQLGEQRSRYEAVGRYERPEHRARALRIFQDAIRALEARLSDAARSEQ